VEVIQGQPGFHSPYRGPQSLFSDDNFRQTSDVDLFFAARIWPGGAIYFNPEYYQGFGFGGKLDYANRPALNHSLEAANGNTGELRGCLIGRKEMFHAYPKTSKFSSNLINSAKIVLFFTIFLQAKLFCSDWVFAASSGRTGAGLRRLLLIPGWRF
jgi:hypothetical protein